MIFCQIDYPWRLFGIEFCGQRWVLKGRTKKNSKTVLMYIKFKGQLKLSGIHSSSNMPRQSYGRRPIAKSSFVVHVEIYVCIWIFTIHLHNESRRKRCRHWIFNYFKRAYRKIQTFARWSIWTIVISWWSNDERKSYLSTLIRTLWLGCVARIKLNCIGTFYWKIDR